MNIRTPVASRFYQLSVWGLRHKLPARVILTLSHALLTALFLMLGAVLISYSGSGLMVLQVSILLLAGGIAVSYGRKNAIKGRAGWAIRKKLEGAFLACGFLLLLLTGPALREDRISFGALPAYASATAAPPAAKKQTRVGQFLKKMRARYRALSEGAKVALTFGIVVMALAVSLGVLALGCSISCNGAEVAGSLISIFGIAGVVVLSIYGIRRVHRK